MFNKPPPHEFKIAELVPRLYSAAPFSEHWCSQIASCSIELLVRPPERRQTLSKRIWFFLLLVVPAVAAAQSPASAVGGNAGLWAGGEISTFNPDYTCSNNFPLACRNQLLGVTALFDFNAASRWGAEGEARWMHWHGEGGLKESNYLIGPRYRVYQNGHFDLWPKLMLGGGWITTPGYPQAGSLQGSFFVIAPAITADYRLSGRWSARADYEYQFWPSFAGPPTVNSTGQPTSHNHGLTPNGFSVGVSYKFLGD